MKTPHQKVNIKIQIEGALEPIINNTFDSDAMYEWYGDQLPLNLYLSNVVKSALAILAFRVKGQHGKMHS